MSTSTQSKESSPQVNLSPPPSQAFEEPVVGLITNGDGRSEPMPALSQYPSFSIGIPSTPPKQKRRHRLKTWIQYWASITPLICGGLGPTVTLMALSGCADKWRSEDILGQPVTEPDPLWVVVVTAIAIVVGFIANTFLLIRMMGRGDPKLMQYLSIILWTLESIMNLTTVALYAATVGDDGPWTYQQGFWMTASSACLSSVCAVLLAINSFILPPFGKRGEMALSGPHRVFVIQIMIFIFWLAIGAALFYGIENFTFSESVYFVDITVTTVGFGDNGPPPINIVVMAVVPHNNIGRALVMPYAIIGILILGLVVSSIRTVVIERSRIRKRVIDAYMNRQQRRLEQLKKQIQRRHAAVLGMSLMVMGPHAQAIYDQSVYPLVQEIHREELKNQRLGIAERWQEFYSLASATLIFAIFWLAGAAIFSSLEGWTYFEGLYFCMIFFLTIGYGDFVVKTNAGRAVYIVYSLFAIPIVTILISLLSDNFFSKFQKTAEKFGVKGIEDKQYLFMRNLRKRMPTPKWKVAFRKVFRRKPKPIKPPKESLQADIERYPVPVVEDEILREEVLEEVESLRQSVSEQVDEELGINKATSHQADIELQGAGSVRKRRKNEPKENPTEDDDESIHEEDVERAIEDTRETE